MLEKIFKLKGKQHHRKNRDHCRTDHVHDHGLYHSPESEPADWFWQGYHAGTLERCFPGNLYASAISTIVMAFLANKPFAMAPEWD